jgi:hypothetical protein
MTIRLAVALALLLVLASVRPTGAHHPSLPDPSEKK